MPPEGQRQAVTTIAVSHRERLLMAAAAALAGRRDCRISIDEIVAKAGATRAIFDANFESERACVLAVQDRAITRFAGVVIDACAARPTWPKKVVASLDAGLGFAASSPGEARLLLLDCVAVDPALIPGALQTHDFLADLLRSGRDDCEVVERMPDLTERGLIGAATSLVSTRLLAAASSPGFEEMRAPLAQIFLAPYVGAEEALRLSTGR